MKSKTASTRSRLPSDAPVTATDNEQTSPAALMDTGTDAADAAPHQPKYAVNPHQTAEITVLGARGGN